MCVCVCYHANTPTQSNSFASISLHKHIVGVGKNRMNDNQGTAKLCGTRHCDPCDVFDVECFFDFVSVLVEFVSRIEHFSQNRNNVTDHPLMSSIRVAIIYWGFENTVFQWPNNTHNSSIIQYR